MKIADNEIHLWFTQDTDIKNNHLINQYKELISQTETEKYQRFHFEEHRHQYLVTRALARCVLSAYNKNILPSEWFFYKGKYGKPYIKKEYNPQNLHFNISHTNGIIIIALIKGQSIGIDIESIKNKQSIMDIAKRFFSASEHQQLQRLPIHKRALKFFELWTLKEAYIKACGMGLAIPLEDFSFSYTDKEKITINFNNNRIDQTNRWNFWQIRKKEDYIISLATKNLPNTSSPNYKLCVRETVPLSYSKPIEFKIYRST